MIPKPDKLFSFHIRRLVRLLPALYAMLAVGWLTGLSEFREGWTWHVTFLTNVQMTIQDDWSGLLIELLQYQGSLLSRAFSNRPLCFLGRISYGLYLWHMLVFFTVAPLLDTWGWEAHSHPYLRSGVLIGGSIFIAWISWIVLERPFIDMGRQLTAAEGGIAQKLARIFKSIAGFSRG